jgi:hypothetical protein
LRGRQSARAAKADPRSMGICGSHFWFQPSGVGKCTWTGENPPTPAAVYIYDVPFQTGRPDRLSGIQWTTATPLLPPALAPVAVGTYLSFLNMSKDEGIRTEWHSKDSVRRLKPQPLLVANYVKEIGSGPTIPPQTSRLACRGTAVEAGRKIRQSSPL